MIVVACALTSVGVIRVTRQHEVLRLGYQLSRDSEKARELREVRRRLEVEHATLTTPDRIRRLATQLGMTTVSPDRIRIVEARKRMGFIVIPFLLLWLVGLVGLPYAPYQPARAMFSSFVAILDIALVFTVFKGDVKLT